MWPVGVAPAAERDIERIYDYLFGRFRDGLLPEDYPDAWFDEIAKAIEHLDSFPERHPYAPERAAWNRDVRNVLLESGYRILFQIYGGTVWVMRIRHQRQKQLRAAGPNTAYRPELILPP